MRGNGRKPRVLFICPSGQIGGMERVVVRLAKQLGLRGWEARIFFASDKSGGQLLKWATAQGVQSECRPEVLELDEHRRLTDVLALRRAIRQFAPDIVNVHYPGSHASIKDVCAIRLAGRSQCFVNVHLPVSWKDAGRKKQLLTRIVGHGTSGVISHSRDLAAIVEASGVPSRRSFVIYNGAEPPEPTPPLSDAAVRREFGIPEHAFVVGILARLAPIKAQSVLISGMQQLLETVPNAFLLLGGDGPDRAALEAQAQTQLTGRYRFVGQLTGTVDAFFAAADVVCLSSDLEGVPMVLIEAALRGRTCVATDVGGISEAVIDGVTGLLVPPRDPAALATALRQMNKEPQRRAEMAAAARIRAQTEFTEMVMAERYDKLFSSSIGRHANTECIGAELQLR